MKSIPHALLLGLLTVLAGCRQAPERDEVYESLLLESVRVSIIFVGENWEIKDAVNAHEISDDPGFHSQWFWSNPKGQRLVVFYLGSQGTTVMRLKTFMKQFRRVSD